MSEGSEFQDLAAKQENEILEGLEKHQLKTGEMERQKKNPWILTFHQPHRVTGQRERERKREKERERKREGERDTERERERGRERQREREQ